ncbi:MAG: hypothetical protein NTNFB01_21580 [Nitrospira sp.]|jgi:hypothetical protein
MEQHEVGHVSRERRVGHGVERNPFAGQGAFHIFPDTGVITTGPAIFLPGEKDDSDDVPHSTHLSFRMKRFV